MPEKANPDVPHLVIIMYARGQDTLNFNSKANADAAVSRLREDVSSSSPGSIIIVEDDNGKSINFRNKNFDRTISRPAETYEMS